MLMAGPTGHAIGGEVAFYYVIPMTALGVSLFLVGYRRRARIEKLKQENRPVLIRREYVDEIVRPQDIAEPDGVIRGVTFTRCQINGPALLCGGGGYLNIMEPYYVHATENTGFLELAPGSVKPDGAIGLSNCNFQSCKFHNVTWALPREDIEKARKQLTVLNRPPNEQPPRP